MNWRPSTHTFWLICPRGPLALPVDVAAEFFDRGLPVFLGGYEAAEILCASRAGEDNTTEAA